jgi:hypothetical protein
MQRGILAAENEVLFIKEMILVSEMLIRVEKQLYKSGRVQPRK